MYLDPHQDVWSRWTGGDGAPLWTLQLAGFDVEHFPECEAAISQETYGRGHSSAEQGQRGKNPKLPKMMWPSNYFKLACATMFTLFWAGERFAPDCVVKDDANSGGEHINIQRCLQTHYINAMAQLLKHLKGLDNVVGIGTMNEPSAGYIGVANLSHGYGDTELRYGLAPTPFQGMCLGEGHTQTVGEWSQGFRQHVMGKPDRWKTTDPEGRRVWGNAGCVWRRAGVWRTNPQTSEPELLLPEYFANVDFGTECYLPFAQRYARTMREASDNAQLMIFVELPPLEFSNTPFPRIPSSGPTGLANAVNATHWYDGVTLFTRSFHRHVGLDTRTYRPVVGARQVFNMHASQLDDIRRLGRDEMGGAPTLIGECGIPIDMRHLDAAGGAFGPADLSAAPRDAFGPQLAAMDHTCRCLEKNLLSFTLWCYTSVNSNAEGDLWNGEDLSLYSADQKRDLDETDAHYIYDGLRAARGFVRPYAQCIAGTPLENGFDVRKGVFLFRGKASETKVDAPTEIFVPKLWCSERSDMRITVLDGRFEVEESKHWFLVKYWHLGSLMRVEIRGPKTKVHAHRVR